jgi:hypothetical protein
VRVFIIIRPPNELDIRQLVDLLRAHISGVSMFVSHSPQATLRATRPFVKQAVQRGGPLEAIIQTATDRFRPIASKLAVPANEGDIRQGINLLNADFFWNQFHVWPLIKSHRKDCSRQ